MRRRFLSILLAILIFSINVPVFAMSVKESEAEGLRDMRVQPIEPTDAPKWIEYVPTKYHNPRTDFKKGNAIAELATGIVLTDLLLTAPIGIPMICHSTTKLKNIGWADKKNKYFEGLEEANNIKDSNERQEHYDKLLKKCKMTEQEHKKQLKRLEKENKKANDV